METSGNKLDTRMLSFRITAKVKCAHLCSWIVDAMRFEQWDLGGLICLPACRAFRVRIDLLGGALPVFLILHILPNLP
jgi:hypothetical protein